MRNTLGNSPLISARRDERQRLEALGTCGLGLALLLLAILGCTTVPPYPLPHEREGLPSWLSPRGQWRISASGIENPQRALDDERGTAAVSGPSYHHAHVTIDLGKPCLFNLVVIDHGSDEFGFCGRMAVLTSTDGSAYQLQRSEPGTRRVSIVCLIRPTMARYVRIRAEEQGPRPWSLAEIYLQ